MRVRVFSYPDNVPSEDMTGLGHIRHQILSPASVSGLRGIGNVQPHPSEKLLTQPPHQFLFRNECEPPQLATEQVWQVTFTAAYP
jgi:hypothetical protein